MSRQTVLGKQSSVEVSGLGGGSPDEQSYSCLEAEAGDRQGWAEV